MPKLAHPWRSPNQNVSLTIQNCPNVRDISVVGKLTSLEILRIHNCQSIEELPADTGKLNRLRVLELSSCKNLKRVAEGVISRLVKLEELIVDCFDEWGAKVKGSEERNASLLELESLPNLTSLEIFIYDSNLVAQQICLSQQLVRYRIFIGGRYIFGDIPYKRLITLHLPTRDIALGNWIHQLVKNTQSLQLTGDGSNCFTLAEIQSLRDLELDRCSTVEFMVDGTIPEGSNFFQNLEELTVVDLPKSAHLLWKSPNQNVSLRNMKRITIYNCPNIRALFPLETARSLVQLQTLTISDCGAMEQVFWKEIESNIEDEIVDEVNRHMIFPKLETLELCYLPCLTTFCGGVESIKFPKLRLMRIADLPKQKEVAPMDSEPGNGDRCLHFSCNQKVEFSCLEVLHIAWLQDTTNKIWCRVVPNNFFWKLKILTVYHVNGIRNLMSSSIAENLVNLEYLDVQRCQEIIEVVEDDKEISVTSLFPRLSIICISNLHKLKSFCQWKHALEFPSLRSISIYDCPGMKTFTSGPLIPLDIFELSIDNEQVEEKDLNGGLRDHFTAESQKARREKRKRNKEDEEDEYTEDEDEDF